MKAQRTPRLGLWVLAVRLLKERRLHIGYVVLRVEGLEAEVSREIAMSAMIFVIARRAIWQITAIGKIRRASVIKAWWCVVALFRTRCSIARIACWIATDCRLHACRICACRHIVAIVVNAW